MPVFPTYRPAACHSCRAVVDFYAEVKLDSPEIPAQAALLCAQTAATETQILLNANHAEDWPSKRNDAVMLLLTSSTGITCYCLPLTRTSMHDYIDLHVANGKTSEQLRRPDHAFREAHARRLMIQIHEDRSPVWAKAKQVGVRVPEGYTLKEIFTYVL